MGNYTFILLGNSSLEVGLKAVVEIIYRTTNFLKKKKEKKVTTR